MYSQATLITAIIFSALASAALISFLSARNSKKLSLNIQELNSLTNNHQKTIHLLEAEYIKSKNTLEVEHYELIKSTKEKSYNEGYDVGVAASQKDQLVELANIKSAHREELAKAENEAEKKGRTIARMEHEAQVKAFGVEIRPYVRIEKKTGVIWDENTSHIGYQYQLLVNGIPAFQPHVLIETSENIKTVDKETIANLIKLAQTSAEIAAKAYLSGTSSNALTVGQEIVKQVSV
ncbi:hypothetical protein [Pseudomonas sp. PA27(2017)]|uniref:hypothetical protein n=1 Tax=Pseudomonas sp. PA27(2017) TaxID=1932112 RepID=UPI0011152037|nr:hypothetical protein [Pseudomonas sp. PA27(2017)]